MKRTPKTNRPFVRTRKSVRNTAAANASLLAHAAGSASRPTVEQLEARQMLFSLTITSENIAPGIGQVSATFGVVIPMLAPTTAPTMVMPPDVTDEDFDDEVQPGPIPPGGLFVPSGFIFNDSNLVIAHTISSQANMRLVPDGATGDEGKLFLRMQDADQFSFQVSAVDGGAGGPFHGMSAISMVFEADGIAYQLDNLRVTFEFDGDVLGTFEGAAISNFAVAPTTSLEGGFNFAMPNGLVFDKIVFDSIGGTTNPGFFLDDVAYSLPSRPFEQIVESRIFGVSVTLSGPIGATAQFLDLNGDDIVRTLALGKPQNADILLVDRNVDGIPDFNDGLGSIILNNTNLNTSLTAFGGTIEEVNGVFVFTLVADLAGFFDDFEGVGFGFEAVANATAWNVAGLPPIGGSLILGSPFVRDLANYNPGGLADGDFDFNRANQGIFVLGGGSMGSINIHGVVHGSSRFEGAVDRISIGYLVGSIAVQGDLGALTVGTDAGLWVPELGPAQRIKTEGQLIVDRTVGEIAIGGRSLMDVTVVGAINTPGASPARDVFRYLEKEFLYAIDPAVPAGPAAVIAASLNNTFWHGLNNLLVKDAQPFVRGSQGSFFGTEFLRNDTLMTAEWVGSIASGVQITGEIGFSDPIQAEDPSDVFAFAVDGNQAIVIEISSFIDLVNVRLVDSSGRTVAAMAAEDFRFGLGFNLEGLLTFTPSSAGVYNLVIEAASGSDGAFNTGTPYVVTIGGLAPTTLGSYRTAASMGDTDFVDSVAVTVLAGSIGSIRVGTGFLAGGGGAGTPGEVFNVVAGSEDDQSTFYSGSFSTPGNVHQILTGGDIGSSTSLGIVTFDIGGRLDQLLTGQNPAIGLDFTQGDVTDFILTVGESIGEFDVRGAIGVDQDTDPDTFFVFPTVVLTTGAAGGPGHIGMIRVGSMVGGDSFLVNTSPDSIVGAFLVNQDNQVATGTVFQGITGGNFGAVFTLGAGSDIRFVDFPTIDLEAGIDITIPIIAGQPLDLTDDAGGRVRIEVRGVPSQFFGIQLGEVRVLPVDQSQGVAIARIDVNLLLPGLAGPQQGQFDLVITSLGSAGAQETISIGHINILSAGGQSSIEIVGTGEIDVWKITMDDGGGGAGTGLLVVANRTPGGDLVVVDLPGLQDLIIEQGNLGRTQTPGVGPTLIGPFLGIGDGGGGGAGETPIALSAALLTSWDGTLFRDTNDATFDATGSLDDIGSPVNPFLNGLIVRGGDIGTVRVSGEIGDVLATAGSIGLVVANSDGISSPTEFHGISGVIFASVDVVRVEVGDGLAQRAQSPISTSGIFAGDDIHQISSTQPGAFLSSTIAAANANAADRAILEFVRDGIEVIEITDGNIIQAHIAAMNLDNFWLSSVVGEVDIFFGDIGRITGTRASILRSTVIANAIDQMIFTDGVYDATSTTARNNLGEIRADQFLNSTIVGSDREFRTNEIIIGGNLGTLTTNQRAGDVSDLRVDVLGSITQEISARNFSRLDLDTDITIFQFVATNDVRGSSITGGGLRNMNVTRNIRASDIRISGVIESITADSILNTSIAVTGPDGEIITIRVRGLLRGTISASGPIDHIQSTEDDIQAFITTTTSRGDIRRLEAFRDLDITTDISGTVSELIAGRHIGNRDKRGIILVRGDLDSVDVSGGQLYADLRVGQEITGEIKIGRVDNRPGAELLGGGSIIAFDRINQITIDGDFDADIISQSGGIGNVTINNGSFLAGNTISAFAGSIDSVIINSGHLLGDIHADRILHLVQLNASADGVFGDIGINPLLSAAKAAGGDRNQLPPGVATTSRIDGPRITSDQNIGRIILTNGSIFEAFIFAKHAVGVINVNGSIQNDSNTIGQGTTTIAAGDLIFSVQATFNIFNTNIVAGILDLGADGVLGGIGDDADTVRAARVRSVRVGKNATNLFVSSGIVAGDDGIYNTADDEHAVGFSWVREIIIGGVATNVSAFADSGDTFRSTGSGTIQIGGRRSPVEGRVLEPVLVTRGADGVPIFSELGEVLTSGVTFNFTSGSQSGTITYSGPGVVVWNEAKSRLMVINTTIKTTLTITSNGSFLSNFHVVSNDDASLDVLDIQTGLFGQSTVTVDAYVRNLTIGSVNDKTTIIIGNDIQNLTIGAFRTGSLSAVFVRNVNIAGDLGGTLNIFGSQGIDIGGDFTGTIHMSRSLRGELTVVGVIDRAAFGTIGSVRDISASGISESFISALAGIGNVNVSGSVFDSSIMAGAYLGFDARPGGTGINADRVASAPLGNVTVGGNFFESDVLAGVLRGPDGFFGTSDDAIAAGRSTIGNVTIAGSGVGSNLGSESFRVATTGELGNVTVGGITVSSTGNFTAELIETQPLPIQIESLRIIEESRLYTAEIVFNQPIDSSTLNAALTVSEVRGSGEINIRLINGQDFTITYIAEENTALIEFSPDVTRRNLPQVPGQPGPGIYRFAFDADLLRAQLRGARVDGDGDGFAEANDDFSSDNIVGDAGDKLVQIAVPLTNPLTGTTTIIDFYDPINLDIVLDGNRVPDSLPDINTPFALRGSIGDHPDHNATTFRFSGDVDVYTITLQAGQILQLGSVTGAANAVLVQVIAPGDIDMVSLPVEPLAPGEIGTPGQNLLISETGQYIIVVSTPENAGAFSVPSLVPNTGPIAGGVGGYEFSIEVFDDGDTGFNAETDAGDGTPIQDAPPADAFAGVDGILGTADDVETVFIGLFEFTLEPGQDGLIGTADDRVIGTDGGSVTSSRIGNVLTATIESAIGDQFHAGVPDTIAPDIDVFHLNAGQPIEPGARIRITVRLSDLGANLGGRITLPGGIAGIDFTGLVQFGVFETTNATSLNDALLVFSPTDFAPIGSEPGVLADDGNTSFGFDNLGDFFVEFLAPGSQFSADPANPDAASYAIYIQGIFNTDYQIEVVQDGTGTIKRSSQNVFIETRGGLIDWLETSGTVTNLQAFSTSVLGFTGKINNVPVDDFVLNTLITNLNLLFASSGIDVQFSTNPSQFEFQDFSTVFLTNSVNPINFFTDRIYGVSEHSDVLNADREDEAAIFIPSMSTLGYIPSVEDIENFTDSLTGAVARRVGELLGLRMTENDLPGDFVGPQGANSVENIPIMNGSYRFSTIDRALSGRFDFIQDTDFFFGRMNSQSLLDAVLSNP